MKQLEEEQTDESRQDPVPLDVTEVIAQARESLMRAVPEAAEELVKGAGKGSVPHIKLLLQLVGLDKGRLISEEIRPREKTLEEIFMERWNNQP